MNECIGVDGLTCIDGWLYSQINMMIFPANRRCDACNKEEEVMKKLKVTFELETREGVAMLLAATKHFDLMPTVSTIDEPEKDKTYENRAEISQEMDWEDFAVTFAQSFDPEGYQVEVQDDDGIIVKTFMHLHEWTGYATPFINEQDAMGLINYMIGLNTTSEGMRDGTTIR